MWDNYPETEESRTHTPPADFPFHELDNVVMTPHRGGAVEESETETLRMKASLIPSSTPPPRGRPCRIGLTWGLGSTERVKG